MLNATNYAELQRNLLHSFNYPDTPADHDFVSEVLVNRQSPVPEVRAVA